MLSSRGCVCSWFIYTSAERWVCQQVTGLRRKAGRIPSAADYGVKQVAATESSLKTAFYEALK